LKNIQEKPGISRSKGIISRVFQRSKRFWTEIAEEWAIFPPIQSLDAQ
jgi:hypothetical protein